MAPPFKSLILILTLLSIATADGDGDGDDDDDDDDNRISNKFDYIIVGAGNAGVVVADRLSAVTNPNGKPRFKVLVIEAGRDLRDEPITEIPIAAPSIICTKTTAYCYFTENQQQVDRLGIPFSRFHPMSRGKGTGGSTAHNSMIWDRGSRVDWDHFSDVVGLSGWGYDDMIPFFKKSERYLESLAGWPASNAAERGTDGKIQISNAPRDKRIF